MEAERETDPLKIYWDHFFKAETGAYEKSTWLDLFLTEFLLRVNDGADPKELINFCPVSGVVSLVGCELLCGIHRVTSTINAQHSVPLSALHADSASASTDHAPAPADSASAPAPASADASDNAGSRAGATGRPAPQSSSLFTRANSQAPGEVLRRYLLGGVAWRCLALLRVLGVEGLSCCRQLSSVLIWVFGELAGAAGDSPSAAPAPAPAPASTPAPDAALASHPPLAVLASPPTPTPIYQLFSHRIWIQPKSSRSRGSKITYEASSAEKRSAGGRWRHAGHSRSGVGRQPAGEGAPRSGPSSGSESGPAGGDPELQAMSQSLGLRASGPPDHFQRRASPRSDPPYGEPGRAARKPKADDYITAAHRRLIDSEITAFQLTRLIVELLRQLCRAESSLAGAEGSQISVQGVGFALRTLCSLQFGSLPARALRLDRAQLAALRVALTELLLVALDRVLPRADLAAKLIGSGVLPMLLRLLEDVICKNSAKYRPTDDGSKAAAGDPGRPGDLLKYVFGVAYSIAAFFHSLLMRCRTPADLRAFTDQFKLYAECLKGDALKESVELMVRIPGADEGEALTLAKKLIDAIGKLVSGAKRIRSEVVHAAACPRARHKACRERVAAGRHHHHDILGEAGRGRGIPLAPACCVAALHGTLAAVLADEAVAARPQLRAKLLRVLLAGGVCCCVPPGALMESAVRLMLTRAAAAPACLRLLEHTVYGELGAAVLPPRAGAAARLPCAVCEVPAAARDDKSSRAFLVHYGSLLQLDNPAGVLRAAVAHLLRVAPRCRAAVRHDLLFGVVYPAFIVAEHRYVVRLEDSAYFLTRSCLAMFASLLDTVSLAERFVEKGGLSYVLELIDRPPFAELCCAILEIAVAADLYKLAMRAGDAAESPPAPAPAPASTQTLFDLLTDATEKCLSALDDESGEKEGPGADERSPTKSSAEAAERGERDERAEWAGPVSAAHTFWRSCAALCLCSPHFRRLLVRERVLPRSVELLRAALRRVCAPAPAPAPATGAAPAPLVELVEALLTAHYALDDVTCSRSKEASGALVKAALASLEGAAAAAGGGGAGAGGGEALRPLCEALIRVATAAPSSSHSMPKRTHAKVPPLVCESGGSEAEWSSSEDSSASPGTSEPGGARAHTHLEEGYEADMELGKLELPPGHSARRLTEALASMTVSEDSVGGKGAAEGAGEGGEGGGGVQCGEYSGGGELAHPELCVLVVDTLTHLIDRLVQQRSAKSEEGGEDKDESAAGTRRVCVALARACCARLAGALAGPRAHLPHPPRAPRPLLQRLLAPPAARLLASDDSDLAELQRSLLELVHVVGVQGVEAASLRALLRPLAGPRAPAARLLPALRRLLHHTHQPHTPDAILTFPIPADHAGSMQWLSEELSHIVLNSATSQSHAAENTARQLREAHAAHGVQSAWSSCAMRCGVEGAGWAPWLQGFALALWLRSAPPDRTPPTTHTPPSPGPSPPRATRAARAAHSMYSADSAARREASSPGFPPPSPGRPPPPQDAAGGAPLAHIISVGHDALLFEVWLDVATGVFTFRLSRPEPSANRVLSEARVPSPLRPHRWSHVALNVRDVVSRRRIHVQVTLFINGYECETASLPLQGLLVRKVTPTSVLLGSSGGGGCAGRGGAYHLASACVYRAPVLAAHTALHLAAHGPDHACQVRCDAPDYPLVITPEVLDSNVDWDQVFSPPGAALRELHDSVLLTFSAGAPAIMNLYHQAAATPTGFPGRVVGVGGGGGGGAGAGGAGGGGGGGGVALAGVPETLFTAWAGAPLASSHRGLPAALHVLGGLDVLLYLFARVVELECSAELQATALWLLLRPCRADARLYEQLHARAALPMLHAVLAAPECRLHPLMLQVFLDEACSSPVMSCGGGGGGGGGAGAVVLARSDAVLLEPRLLVFLARAWKQLDAVRDVTWEEEGGGARTAVAGSMWALTLRCVLVLLREEHPRRAFNHYQMSRLQLLHHLLLACKERFLISECGPLEPAASGCLVALVRALLGSPPLPHHIALLCDFLILMHQASDTFVTHSRANFYFLLSAAAPEHSEPGLLSFMGGRRLRRRSSAAGSPACAARSPSADEDNGDDDELSLEPTKQMKSIINEDIKMSRKYSTSTLDNFESITADGSSQEDEGESEREVSQSGEDGEGAKAGEEEAGAGSGSSEDALRDYIVVEPREVADTAGDTVTGGVGEQRVVRAGLAGEWATCAGLVEALHGAVRALPAPAPPDAQLLGMLSLLAVLAQHRAAAVRAQLVLAAGALQRRASPDVQRRLRAAHYYVHLADQLALYPPDEPLAAAAAALLTKCDVPLQDQLDDDIWMEVSEECVHRSPPLLALLPASLHDVPLAHNLTLLVRRIIDKASLKVLGEVSVAEVCVRCVRAAGRLPARLEGCDLLRQDLHELLGQLARKALISPHGVQTVLDLHYMLSFVESEAEERRAGAAGEGGAAAEARAAQAALFVAQLDCLEERLQAPAAGPRPAGYFTNVLSATAGAGGGAGGGSEAVPRAELAARHQGCATRALAFLWSRSPRRRQGAEAALFYRLLDTLLRAVSSEGGGAAARPKWWASNGVEWARALQELFWWGCAPAAGVRPLQPRLLLALYLQPAAAHALTPADPASQRKLAVYLLTALQQVHLCEELELPITDWVRGWALGTQAALAERVRSDALRGEAGALLRADTARWARTAASPRHRASLAKAVFGKEALAAKVTETAMAMTRQVVDVQNGERKAFMEHLRQAQADAAAAAQRWQRLVLTTTHEQALWHRPGAGAQSWQLDPTEGPARVRVRLRRAHLNIHPRFLKPQYRYKADVSRRSYPLRSVVGVVGSGGGGGVGRGVCARLQRGEAVAHTARATHVTVARDAPVELLLTDRSVHLVPEAEADEAHCWPLEALVDVAPRRWCLQERAVELFLSTGHAHLLAFAARPDRDAFLKALDDCHLPNRREPETLSSAMAQWRAGQLTNWEYIMKLNGLAGRSYNDLMQYPVLPFVLADYESRVLDLAAPASFRDLARPVAIQSPAKEQHYINTYNELSAAGARQPHHYASLYSNSGAVLHYLVRVPPFTELFLNYQDNNFDMPDRTFHSLATTWRLITQDSPTDVKELIPELFYLPEMFHNNEGLNLGVRQCGLGVDSVTLPAWAADARHFTLLHRQALEAAHVTERLPHWIDLVFGYKQTGQPARDAINVFPACTYYGFDPSAMEDEVDRSAAETMVRTYGQVPRQLLRSPHPHAAGDLAALARGAADTGAGSPVCGAALGLRWGRYCGSPELPAPAVVARRALPGAARLHALPHARSAAVATRSSALLALRPPPDAAGPAPPPAALALISWGHSDSIVRLKRRRDVRPDLVMQVSALDQITAVSTSCSMSLAPVVIGYASGRVVALVRAAGGAAGAAGAGGAGAWRERRLHAHAAPLAAVHVCARAGLVATACREGKIVLWDLNKLTYIRTLPNRDMLPVTAVTISDTLCDVATVHDAPDTPDTPDTPDIPDTSDAHDTAGAPTEHDDLEGGNSYEKDATYKYKSLIRVHTVNGSYVGSVKVSEEVTCVCYSGAPEGASANSVAAALRSGGVRLYSSWDLRPVAYVPPANVAVALVSIAYSSDSALLFGCYEDGLVVAWESGAAGRPAPVRLLPAHALF